MRSREGVGPARKGTELGCINPEDPERYSLAPPSGGGKVLIRTLEAEILTPRLDCRHPAGQEASQAQA